MAEIIQTPLTVMHVLSCLFLILVILIQPGKSGGGGIFGSAGAQQVFGGRGAGNFLTKTTWATAILFFSTSITLAYLSSSSDEALQKKSQVGGMSKGLGKPIHLKKR
ncbi:MAG TPA: preprotein translocase subunit SecG [Polyangiaceae bacterium]|jgi:preprotein translocase subunit SecG|nr:preprotein translocase subunit SecG [Polyangiaceae bacterium]